MLSKCANPTCSTQLVYLREGKIFMVESSELSREASVPALSKKPSRIEHFWLCGNCSTKMTLAFDREAGVQIVRKAQPREKVLRAAAS